MEQQGGALAAYVELGINGVSTGTVATGGNAWPNLDSQTNCDPSLLLPVLTIT